LQRGCDEKRSYRFSIRFLQAFRSFSVERIGGRGAFSFSDESLAASFDRSPLFFYFTPKSSFQSGRGSLLEAAPFAFAGDSAGVWASVDVLLGAAICGRT
jgi:hypothetical protein